MRNPIYRCIPFLIIFFICLISINVSAQVEDTSNRRGLYDDDAAWKALFAFYFQGVQVDASAQVGENEIPIEVNLDDVFDHMFSGSLTLEARRQRWNFGADLSYTKQNRSDNVEFDGDNGASSDTARLGLVYQTGRIDGFASYRFGKPETAIEVLGGFRYSDFVIEGNVKQAGEEIAREKFDRSIFDPILGVRFTADVSKELVFFARGIAGGFGLNSERIYDFNLGFLYGLTRLTYISLQYRWIDQLYESGAGDSLFKYDGSQHGVLFGFAFIL